MTRAAMVCCTLKSANISRRAGDVVIADMKAEGDNAEFYKLLEDADVVINSYVYFGKKEIDALKKCKCISFQSTGYNEVDLDYAAEKGIAVASILDYCTQETAENAIATMLCLQRGTLIYNRSIQEDKVWDCTVVQHQQRVEGQTMGIVGLGRIGRHVARIAGKGLGMKILAYDPFLPPEIAEAAGATLVDLDTIFAESDVISIHMNLTEDNVHMFDREAFSKMKKKPFIINEGRGPMISEEALPGRWIPALCGAPAWTCSSPSSRMPSTSASARCSDATTSSSIPTAASRAIPLSS